MKSKYIFVLQNLRDYQHEVDDPDFRVSEYSVIAQFPVSPKVRQDVPMMLHRTEISYAQYPWSISFDKEIRTIFTIGKDPTRLLPYENNWAMAITYEHGKTLKKSTRIDYTILDLAS